MMLGRCWPSVHSKASSLVLACTPSLSPPSSSSTAAATPVTVCTTTTCSVYSHPLTRLHLSRRGVLHGSLACTQLALLFSSTVAPRPSFAITEDEELEEWYRFEGEGFAVSVPPDFEDIREPEEYVGGPLYGNKAKAKPFAARFASPDRSEVISVVIRQSSQLKLTFLAVKDVTDLGSLREASNIFVPVGAKLYAARTITTSDEDSKRTYYYYEFATGDNYIAVQAGASSGKIFVMGVTASKNKWKDDGRKLRLAAKSFSVL